MQHEHDRIISSMHTRSLGSWSSNATMNRTRSSFWAYSSAGIICLATAAAIVTNPSSAVQVMNQLESGFDYDETLGRIQYVSNILPESAMVFLSENGNTIKLSLPMHSEIIHSWSEIEPWTEFSGKSDVFTCQSGEVAAVVKGRKGRYTVRILHQDGYESVYSGLSSSSVREHDIVGIGAIIGTTEESAAFEIRKDGLSIYPVFDR